MKQTTCKQCGRQYIRTNETLRCPGCGKLPTDEVRPESLPQHTEKPDSKPWLTQLKKDKEIQISPEKKGEVELVMNFLKGLDH